MLKGTIRGNVYYICITKGVYKNEKNISFWFNCHHPSPAV